MHFLLPLELSFGVLPLLEVDGSKIVISGRASARFVARKLGFLGQNELEEAKINEILDGSHDYSSGKIISCIAQQNLLIDAVAPILMQIVFFYPFVAFLNIQLATTKETKEEAGKSLVLVTTPKYMRYFNKIIEENASPNGFMVGNQLTLADLHVFNLVTLPNGEPHQIVTDDCQGLKNLVLRVAQIPQIKKWLEVRPQCSF